MTSFQPIREKINSLLFDSFVKTVPTYFKIYPTEAGIMDHIAIIDIVSENSGINHLVSIFSRIGYSKKGSDFIESKNNDFVWLAEENVEKLDVKSALP